MQHLSWLKRPTQPRVPVYINGYSNDYEQVTTLTGIFVPETFYLVISFIKSNFNPLESIHSNLSFCRAWHSSAPACSRLGRWQLFSILHFTILHFALNLHQPASTKTGEINFENLRSYSCANLPLVQIKTSS